MKIIDWLFSQKGATDEESKKKDIFFPKRLKLRSSADEQKRKEKKRRKTTIGGKRSIGITTSYFYRGGDKLNSQRLSKEIAI